MRIIWYPMGHDLWFDLAVKMRSGSRAKIVIWLGNDRPLKKAKMQLSGAKKYYSLVLNFGKIKLCPSLHQRNDISRNLGWPMNGIKYAILQ